LGGDIKVFYANNDGSAVCSHDALEFHNHAGFSRHKASDRKDKEFEELEEFEQEDRLQPGWWLLVSGQLVCIHVWKEQPTLPCELIALPALWGAFKQ
jgi:hypothetical protein